MQRLANERAQARALGDAMANLACLATVADGAAAARMLVLRDLGDELALFFSDTSAKALHLATGMQPEVLVYLPSLNVQYRLGVTLRALDTALLDHHWQRRPEAAKRIDWFYNTVATQGTPMASRDALREALHANTPNASMTQPPPGARGYYLDAHRVERLHILDSDPPHDRRLYTRPALGDLWREVVLVP